MLKVQKKTLFAIGMYKVSRSHFALLKKMRELDWCLGKASMDQRAVQQILLNTDELASLQAQGTRHSLVPAEVHTLEGQTNEQITSLK